MKKKVAVEQVVEVDIELNDVVEFIEDATDYELAVIRGELPPDPEFSDTVVIVDYSWSLMDQIAAKELNEWLLLHSPEEAMKAIRGYEKLMK